MYGLTIHQPWAWAMCHAGRDLENRDWRPPPYVAHQVLALHASKKWSRQEKLDASALSCQLHPEHEVPLGGEGYVLGAIVAIARVVGFVDTDLSSDRGPYSFEMQTTKGYVVVGGQIHPESVERAVTSPWFKGPCAWLLNDIRILPEPVPVRGYKKVWTVPAPVALDVIAQVGLK